MSKADKGEFRCGYCDMDTLKHEDIRTELPIDQQYGYEIMGQWVWVEEESEEGYRCQTCGSHCSTEEVYWWHPDDDLLDESDGE